MNDPLRIGTRGSKLALYQANWVKDTIAERLGRACELVILKTHGDKDTSKPIAELGGVGVFVKELERALLAHEVDLAVHSLKDLPTDIPEGLCVAAYPIRVSPHESLLVHPDAVGDGPIPVIQGATIGTSSLRRQAQLKEHRPDLNVISIRGNVPTRIDKARTREVDAVMLAAAGIDRLELDLEGVARFDLSEELLVPAPGQGALAIEIRDGEPELLELIGRLNDLAAQHTTEAERQLLHGLGAGCSVPLGARAVAVEVDGAEQLELRAVYEIESGQPLRRVCVRGATAEQTAELALRVLDPPPASEGADLPDLHGKRVLIAREPQPSQHLVRLVEAAGGSATCRAPSETVWNTVALPASDWVLFASFRGVEAVERSAEGSLAQLLAGRRVGAVGAATARALGERGVPVELLPTTRTGAGLAAALLAHVGEVRPSVVLPAAKGGRPELKDALSAAGCVVTALELYESTPRAAPAADELAVDALVLASPSGAKATLAGATSIGCKLVAIGPTTAKAIEELGHTVAETAETPNTAGLLAALGRALT